MNDRFVLITGVSRGIGQATAAEFSQHNYRVIGTSTAGIDSTYQLNLSSEQSISEFVTQLTNRKIHLSGLINNAAIMVDQKESSIDIVKLRQTLEVNLIGTISLTEKLLPLITDGGVIVNLSSELGSLVQNMPNKAYSYRISKTAINMYTRTLAQRLASRDIKVYSFAPGWVKTDMGTQYALRQPQEPAREIMALFESGRESGQFYEQDHLRDW